MNHKKPSPSPPRPAGGTKDAVQATFEVLFDPQKPEAELFDALAERQAKLLTDGINATQLRRYFGELKMLFNQYRSLVAGASGEPDGLYRERIEPRFKMLRSKIAYGQRSNARGSLSREFAQILNDGIVKVRNARDFELFVTHVEAVVGFMYGNGKVKK